MSDAELTVWPRLKENDSAGNFGLLRDLQHSRSCPSYEPGCTCHWNLDIQEMLSYAFFCKAYRLIRTCRSNLSNKFVEIQLPP